MTTAVIEEIHVREAWKSYTTVASVSAVEEVVRLLGATMPHSAFSAEQCRPLSLTELQGLGREIWEGLDPVDYVSKLRDEWEDR